MLSISSFLTDFPENLLQGNNMSILNQIHCERWFYLHCPLQKILIGMRTCGRSGASSTRWLTVVWCVCACVHVCVSLLVNQLSFIGCLGQIKDTKTPQVEHQTTTVMGRVCAHVCWACVRDAKITWTKLPVLPLRALLGLCVFEVNFDTTHCEATLRG